MDMAMFAIVTFGLFLEAPPYPSRYVRLRSKIGHRTVDLLVTRKEWCEWVL